MFTRLSAAIVIFLAPLSVPALAIAEGKGQSDLDRAIEIKLSAENLRELTAVVDLCQSALDKGLDDDNSKFAKQLLTSTLLERAQTLSGGIFDAREPDPRWPELRKLAMVDLERALTHDPDQAAAHVLVGKLQALPRGDRKRAVSALNEAIRLQEDDPPARAQTLLLRAGLREDVDARLADLAEAIELAPTNAAMWRARGGVQLMRAKADEALSDFDEALRLAPDDAATHEARGLALGMLKRWDEARASYSRAAELAPNSPSPFLERGRISLLSGDNEAALKDINEALQVDPNNLAALLFRAQVQAQSNQVDLALADVNRVLELSPGLAPALRTRAMLSATAGRLAEAVADLEEVARQEPNNPTTHIQLGMVYGNGKHFAKAIEAYTAALALEPAHPGALRLRGDAYLSVGKQREAIADYEAVMEADPKNSGALNNLAWVLATSPDEGLRNAQRSIELATLAAEVTEFKQPHILSTLAAGYAEAGNFDMALHWSQTAVNKAAELNDETMKENLEKELASYREHKPWREVQNEPLEPAEEPPAPDDVPPEKPEDSP